MDSHLVKRFSTEELSGIARSVEFFTLAVFAISVLGFIFFAAV